MCTCMPDMLEKVKQKLMENLPNHKNGSFYASFANEAISMPSFKSDVYLSVNYQYRSIKKDRSEAKNDTKKNISIAMNYCPFCGIKKDASS